MPLAWLMASKSQMTVVCVYAVFADRMTSDCYCAPGILLGLTVDAMGTCRVACDDAGNISCGGVNTPIVYSAGIGGIFPELAARLAVPLPLYECDAKSKFDFW